MHVQDALRILAEIGMPRAQQNERSALCLLALCDLKKDDDWSDASAALIGVTPIMDFALKHYRKKYAPNTRENVRRRTLHQFVAAGVAAYNPDKPDRPVNSPDTVYRLTPEMLRLVRAFGRRDWPKALREFVELRPALASQYAKPRSMRMVQLLTAPGKSITLSPGAHSELIKHIVEVFGPRFAPGGRLLYAGDTGVKWGYHDAPALAALGVNVDSHGKMPDAVIHLEQRNWLLLCEAVTSHGPVDAKRHGELKQLFSGCTAGLVFVTAFPDRKVMARHLSHIAWETEVWCAESPDHLIHFNGERFLGPYSD